MSLDRAQVKKIAYLARLHLDDEELDRMTTQLGRIVEFVDALSHLDTDGVEPLVHAVELINVLAPDDLRPSLDRREALANAPQSDGECFRVPAVL